MRRKKVIGITQRVDKIGAYAEDRDSIDERMISWAIKADFMPVSIPNNLVDISDGSQLLLDQWLELIHIDAIILSGGNDIGNIAQRDMTETCLLSWAENNNKPVLGICRGMQMMGVYSGGSLKKVGNHVGACHKLQLEQCNQDDFPELVNSYHNMALKDCPESFQVLARAEDGNIEAMKHKKLPWEAWMWHPERENPFSNIDINRFKRLINNV